MNCPRCFAPMERRDAQFFWRGEYRPGFVCVPCNALYPVPGEEIAPLAPGAQPEPPLPWETTP